MPRRRRKRRQHPDARFLAAPAIALGHDDTLGDLAPLPHFAGPSWDVTMPGHARRAHLDGQRDRCLEHLAAWDASAEPGAEPPAWLIREATVILRAGPAATLLELTRGRIA